MKLAPCEIALALVLCLLALALLMAPFCIAKQARQNTPPAEFTQNAGALLPGTPLISGRGN